MISMSVILSEAKNLCIDSRSATKHSETLRYAQGDNKGGGT